VRHASLSGAGSEGLRPPRRFREEVRMDPQIFEILELDDAEELIKHNVNVCN
jgi:hypothetical protein